MARIDEAACVTCYRVALEAAADRLAPRYDELGFLAYGVATEELATNLMASGQVTCSAHRPAFAQAAS